MDGPVLVAIIEGPYRGGLSMKIWIMEEHEQHHNGTGHLEVVVHFQ
jgi:hypothetical protein